MQEPLASFLRPQTLEEMVGQEKIIETVKTFLSQGTIPSMIFRWTPWCGKTTLAKILSHELQADFFELSGVKSKKEDLMQILELAQKKQAYGTKTLLFLDEIHRRNKAQQDTLLPFVESWVITLIGATTENPSFTINNALISRCKVLVFQPLTEDQIFTFFQKQREKILTQFPEIQLNDENFRTIAQFAHGDLRSACNLLEASILLTKQGELTTKTIETAFGNPLYYDRDGEEHYNIISAVHKSLRDSDGNAACYWIQRMLYAGEDPLYLCRRMLRFASEDIGPADNNALLLANQVYDAVKKIWMPECKVFLFQLAIYLAKTPKNNICEKIDLETMEDIKKYGNLPVPMQIRNAPTSLMKNLGYGKGYQYAHDHPENRQADGTIKMDNQHFPDELKGRKYY